MVVKEVVTIIFFTTAIHQAPHFFSEHVLNKVQKAFIDEMTSLAKRNNLRVPRVEGNVVIGMGIGIGIEVSEKGVSSWVSKWLISPIERSVLVRSVG